MSVRKDKRNGSWMYDGKYKLPDGKYKSYHKSGFSKRRDALAAEVNFLAKLNPTKSITFNQLNEIWSDNALDLKENTLINHNSRHEQVLSKRFGEMRIEDINSFEVEKFKNELVAKGYKEGTINTYLKHLRKMFNYAVKRDLLTKNPCSTVSFYHNPNVLNKSESEKIWLKEDFKKYIKEIKKEYQLFFITLYTCGFREGEALGITWNDIDFENKKICINKQWSDGQKKITTTKTSNSNRNVPITDMLCNALKKRLESQKEYDGFTFDWFVFGSYKPFPLPTIKSIHKRAIDISNVPYLSIHAFRHTCASNLIKLGTIPDIMIAEYLGDTIETIYKTYAHVYEDTREEMRGILNAEFSDIIPTE